MKVENLKKNEKWKELPKIEWVGIVTKIRLAFQGVSVCSSSVTSDGDCPFRASGSSRPALWIRSRPRSPGRLSPAGRATPGRSGCPAVPVASGRSISSELSPFRCRLFACRRFPELVLKSAISSRSDCSKSVGLSSSLLFSSLSSSRLVQRASHRCTWPSSRFQGS